MKTIRPDSKTYMIFSIMITLPILIGIIAGIENPSANFGIIVYLLTVAIIWLYFVYGTIVIYDDHIEFRTLYSRKAMKFSDVKNAKIHSFVDDSYFDRLKPPIKLWIYPKPESGKKPIWINAKIFKKEDLSYVLDLVNERKT